MIKYPSHKKDLILITGGHLTPAVAVLSELRKRGFNNFLWVGHKYNQAGNKEFSPEYQTIKNSNIEFIDLKTGKIIRKWTRETFIYGLKQFYLVFVGLFKSLFIILNKKPKLILSFGGYLAVPIVIWAKFLGVKVITHDQVVTPGLANKIISRFADKILVSWESSKKFFNSNKTIFTGNPIRREIFLVKSNTLTKDFFNDLPILYITGGNQGANEINKRIFPILNMLLEDCNIIHQTGNSTTTNDYQKALDLQKNLPQQLRYRYLVKDYILADEIGEAFNKSNLIFSRAGGNTVVEILALGKLAIFMPIPWASHDEQTKNAEMVKSTGLGYILIQKDYLSAQTVYQTILLGLSQYKKEKGFDNRDLKIAIDNAKSLVVLDAPIRVVDEIESIL